MQLRDSLAQIDAYESALLARREKDTIHIPTVGSKISTAYEQLRNASEYAEENQMRRRAIRRYLKRELSFHTKAKTNQIAEELITELTQAEYLPNDHTTANDLATISDHLQRHYGAYWQYAKIESSSKKRQEFQKWVLDVASVRCEQVLTHNIRELSFTHLAFTYLQPKITSDKMIRDGEAVDPSDFPLVLYLAIQQAILKSDLASMRVAVLDSYRQDISKLHNFEAFNAKIDYLIESKTLAYTTRIVNRNGAALRMLYSGFFTPEAPVTSAAFKSEDALEYALRDHIEKEYAAIDDRLDKGIVRSITFLLVTKSLIGLGIEIPYDLWAEGGILWLPLILNLFFPALFIAISRLTLSTPGARNTDAIIRQLQDMILFREQPQDYAVRIPRATPSIGFNLMYTALFGLVFAGVGYLLYWLQFNIVQGVIFFIFMSTASFLAFRLSNQIREVEAVHSSQGSLALMRDVIYTPFIYVGQQISYRYSKMNIIAAVLDVLIELPLKNLLRISRQWTQFLSSKRDELL